MARKRKNKQKEALIEEEQPAKTLKEQSIYDEDAFDDFDDEEEEDATNADFLPLNSGSKVETEGAEGSEVLPEGYGEGKRTFPKKYRVKETNDAARYIWKSKCANASFNLVDVRKAPSEVIMKTDSMNFKEQMFNRHKRISSTAQLGLRKKQQVNRARQTNALT